MPVSGRVGGVSRGCGPPAFAISLTELLLEFSFRSLCLSLQLRRLLPRYLAGGLLHSTLDLPNLTFDLLPSQFEILRLCAVTLSPCLLLGPAAHAGGAQAQHTQAQRDCADDTHD